MAGTWRIGAVEYLNSKPLIHELERLLPTAMLVLDLPSRLADELAAGRLDVALIPVVEFLRGPGYRMLPGIAIASRGAVLSVNVFSRVPWPEIRTLALDVGSRTSSALTQVLSRQRFGVEPQYMRLPVDQPVDDVAADAVLLIGDRAMRASLPGFAYSYDLGQEWFDWTGLPFVYAVWAVRPGVELGAAEAAFTEAKRRGVAALAQIAQSEAARLGLDPAYCRRYLSHVIRFDLGPAELAGLARFQELTAAAGLVPTPAAGLSSVAALR